MPSKNTPRPSSIAITSVDQLLGVGIKPARRIDVPEMGTYAFLLPITYGQVRKFEAVSKARKNKANDDTSTNDAMMALLTELLIDLLVTEDGKLILEGQKPQDLMGRLPMPVISALSSSLNAAISDLGAASEDEEKKLPTAAPANED